MTPTLVTDPALQPLLDALRPLEPLIYAANGGLPRAHFERLLAPGFWEVGASGLAYSREHVLDVLEARQREPREEVWSTTGHHLQAVGPSHWLLSYTLHQPTRVSKRATLWTQTEQGWQMVYHQGTVVL